MIELESSSRHFQFIDSSNLIHFGLFGLISSELMMWILSHKYNQKTSLFRCHQLCFRLLWPSTRPIV